VPQLFEKFVFVLASLGLLSLARTFFPIDPVRILVSETPDLPAPEQAITVTRNVRFLYSTEVWF
jgi:hypothetical protein